MSHRLEQLLSSAGDGTGVTEMAAAAAVYKVSPPENFTWTLHRMNGYIEDNGKFRGEWYGATSALANGIVITKENSGGVITTYTPETIKRIGHWSLVAGVDMYFTEFTTGNDMCMVRWTFTRGGGVITLRGDYGEFLKMNIQDNLGAGGAALVSHIFQVQGIQEWTG